jgi:hypothetical protein
MNIFIAFIKDEDFKKAKAEAKAKVSGRGD